MTIAELLKVIRPRHEARQGIEGHEARRCVAAGEPRATWRATSGEPGSVSPRVFVSPFRTASKNPRAYATRLARVMEGTTLAGASKPGTRERRGAQPLASRVAALEFA